MILGKKNKRFWNFKSLDEKTGELTLYGEISNETWWGDEVTPKEFKSDLDNLGEIDTLNIYINSPGGDVFAGQTIYSILKRHKAHKNVYIDGLAASIASVIAMAGNTIFMPKNAMMMIHNPWTVGMGNADEFRKLAEDLDKIRESLIAAYENLGTNEVKWTLEKLGESVNYNGELTNDGGKISISDTGEFTLTATIIDGEGRLFTHNKKITITNTAPTVTLTATPTRTVKDGKFFVDIKATANDADGDATTLEYEGTTSDNYYSVGTHTVRVRAKDIAGAYSSWAEKSFTIVNSAVSDIDIFPPSFVSSPL
jgi:ATP-dependent protease ClpP protease subunit